jgi:hypothetical protein
MTVRQRRCYKHLAWFGCVAYTLLAMAIIAVGSGIGTHVVAMDITVATDILLSASFAIAASWVGFRPGPNR